MKCLICNDEICSNQFGYHLLRKHRIKLFEYAVQYLNVSNVPPLCSCGCGAHVRGQWKGVKEGWPRYISGHNSKSDHPLLGRTKENHSGLKRTSNRMMNRVLPESDKKKIAETLKSKHNAGELQIWNKGQTKYTNSSIDKYATSLKGNTIPVEIKNKISESVKKYQKENPITTEQRTKLSISASKQASENKLWAQSDEGKQKLSKLLTKRNLEGKRAVTRFPTKLEQKLIEWFPNDLTYVGDRKHWVTFNGKHKNPDFICTNNKHAIIEVFGDYWHTKEEIEIYIKGYESIGKQCLILWQSEIDMFPEVTKIKIKEFIDASR